MKINPVHALLNRLQQQAGTAGVQGKKPDNLAKLVEELTLATDAQRKVSVVERIQKELGTQRTSAAAPFSKSAEHPVAETPGTWRMSSLSTESMNGLTQQRSARHWELEAVLQALMNSPMADKVSVDEAGVAAPFRPTAEDVEKAIESLGLSPRQLFRDDLYNSQSPRRSELWPEAVQRLLIIMVGLGLLFTVVLVI